MCGVGYMWICTERGKGGLPCGCSSLPAPPRTSVDSASIRRRFDQEALRLSHGLPLPLGCVAVARDWSEPRKVKVTKDRVDA